MSRTEFYVAMENVPSSAVFNGTQKQCEAVAARLNRRSTWATWIVIPCVG